MTGMPEIFECPDTERTFRVHDAVAASAEGTVYQVRDVQTDQDYALKELNERGRLLASAEGLNAARESLRDLPFVAKHELLCLEGKRLDGVDLSQHTTAFDVVQWIDGPSLSKFVQSADLEVLARIEPLRTVAAALDRLHTSDPAIIHRDVKSDNIMVDRSTNQGWLIDLNTVRPDEHETQQIETQIYAAPAHWGLTDGVAKDRFGFMCTLVECMGGRDLLRQLSNANWDLDSAENPPPTLPINAGACVRAVCQEAGKGKRPGLDCSALWNAAAGQRDELAITVPIVPKTIDLPTTPETPLDNPSLAKTFADLILDESSYLLIRVMTAICGLSVGAVALSLVLAEGP